VTQALEKARTTPGERIGELDNPRTAALVQTLDRVQEYLTAIEDANLMETVPEACASANAQVAEAVRAVKRMAWNDESISVADAQYIDREIAYMGNSVLSRYGEAAVARAIAPPRAAASLSFAGAAAGPLSVARGGTGGAD